MRKYWVFPATVLVAGVLVSWLYVLLNAGAMLGAPSIHNAPGGETWQWLESFKLAEEERAPAVQDVQAIPDQEGPSPVSKVLPLPPPDPWGGRELELEIHAADPEESIDVHAAPPDLPENIEKGDTTITPEPPMEFGGEQGGQGEQEVQEVSDERQEDGEYLGSIRTSVYAFTFERLGLSNIPVARPDRTYWNAQRWDNLEEQLQTAMRFGLTVYPHSPPPGLPGNLVISGHSSPPTGTYESNYGKIFAVLPGAKAGDRIAITQGGNAFTYEVTDIRVVPATAVDVLLQDGDRKELTLITCYPVGTTEKRLIVRAELVEDNLLVESQRLTSRD